jgi:hypothetical protein
MLAQQKIKMARHRPPYERSVFLNVPFDTGYERNFVALIASIISLGRVPRCVLELPELGKGRLSRVFNLLEQCRVSIHDLSRVNMPVRFNMPFELGLACALARYRKPHDYILMEKKSYRLDQTLSDLKGRDPLIHHGSPRRVISCVLDVLRSGSNNPDPVEVSKNSIELSTVAENLKRRYSVMTIFNRSIFHELVAVGIVLAVNAGHVKKKADLFQ